MPICQLRFSLAVASLVLFLTSVWSMAMDMVRDGKATCAIVVPGNAVQVVDYAAEELQYHIGQATGADLPIVREGTTPIGKNRIYLGHCRATAKVGIRPDKLPPNSFVIRLSGTKFFLAGKDTAGRVFHPIGKIHNERVQCGTLFAVYEFLEQHMKVRWLWPGKLGEVIPKRSDLSVTRWDQTHVPKLIHKRWRDSSSLLNSPKGWADDESRKRFLRAQGVWLRRHRFALGRNLDATHAFGEYWKRFGKPQGQHLEYFNLLPDGTRRPDPCYLEGRYGHHVTLCVSQPALWKQIIEDWKRNPQARLDARLDVSENDAPGKCTCPNCLAWDVPSPELNFPWAERVINAKRAFLNNEQSWYRNLGSLSDRYAKFYLTVQQLASKIDPNVNVIGLAYANYMKPPIKAKLNEHVIIVIVPGMRFPWTVEKRRAFREQWEGWRATGARLLLRPNYTLYGHCMPVFLARPIAEDFSFAFKRGMIGTDFDALIGQYATQGPTMYVLARLHTHGDWAVDRILDEYYQGFGPAQAAVREYFRLWERITNDAAKESGSAKATKKRPIGWSYKRFYLNADILFTAQRMARGRAILAKAQNAARGDPLAQRRVAFLQKGLRNAELTLAAQATYRRYKQGQGSLADHAAALRELDVYRASVERDLIANMGFLAWAEGNRWDRSIKDRYLD